jgi:hypothetical protein
MPLVRVRCRVQNVIFKRAVCFSASIFRADIDNVFSLHRNDIGFYFDFVFDLNGSARDADAIYAEVALLERCGTAIVPASRKTTTTTG